MKMREVARNKLRVLPFQELNSLTRVENRVRNRWFALFELTNHLTKKQMLINVIFKLVLDWPIQTMRINDFEPWLEIYIYILYL